MTSTAAAGVFGSLSGTLQYVVDKQWSESLFLLGPRAVSDEEDDLTLGIRVNSLKAFGISLRAVRRPTEGSGTVHQGF